MKNPDVTEQEKAPTPVACSDWLDAGSVAPSCKRYVVTWPHGHKHLKGGDVVVMVETPRLDNCLLRESDMTLHHLQGQSDQYIHLAEVKASNA